MEPMVLPNIIAEVWGRAEGRCECTDQSHNHPYIRCNRPLVLANKDTEKRGGWRVLYLTGVGGEELSSYRILCWECYRDFA